MIILVYPSQQFVSGSTINQNQNVLQISPGIPTTFQGHRPTAEMENNISHGPGNKSLLEWLARLDV